MRTHSKKERIMAWIGIVALLALYVISFILGVLGSKSAFPMFVASLLATFFIPAMLYLFQFLMRRARDNRITGEIEEIEEEK